MGVSTGVEKGQTLVCTVKPGSGESFLNHYNLDPWCVCFIPYSTPGGLSLAEHCQAVNIQGEEAIVARFTHTGQSLVNTPVDS